MDSWQTELADSVLTCLSQLFQGDSLRSINTKFKILDFSLFISELEILLQWGQLNPVLLSSWWSKKTSFDSIMDGAADYTEF